MSRGWMPLYVADYLADTTHLSTFEHGVYVLLIMHYWQKGSLPKDDARLASIARTTSKQWHAVKATIAEFFDDEWKHKRIEQELEKARVSYSKRAAAGREGGLMKASNAVAMLTCEPSIAKPMPEQCCSNELPNARARQSQSQSQSQDSITKTESLTKIRSNASAFDQFWIAYPKHVAKKAAEKKFISAVKSGIPPDQIIAAAKRYSKACQHARLEKQFIKAPDVWLNKGCYLDEDLPSGPRAGPKHLNGFAAVLSEIEEAEMRVNEQFGKNNSGQNDIGTSPSDALQIGKRD